MRVRRITATDPAKAPEENKVLDYRYNYDKMDNITTRTTEHGNYGYGYDDLYRLTEADSPDGAGLSDEAFTYDKVGNRLTSAGAPGPWAGLRRGLCIMWRTGFPRFGMVRRVPGI